MKKNLIFTTLWMMLICGITTTLNSCQSMVYDQLSPCPTYIGFEYTYNILKYKDTQNNKDVDLFYKQADDVRLLAFNKEGVLIRQWEEKDRTYPEHYRKMVYFPRETYKVVAISGLDDKYLPITFQDGKTHYDDVRIVLATYDQKHSSASLKPLLKGEIDNIHLTHEEGDTHIIRMKKWTNTIKLLFRDQDNQPIDFNPENYTFELITKDGTYTLDGEKKEAREMTYTPYFTAPNGNKSGGTVEFSVMKLMENEPIVLKIIRKSDNETLINANLIEMLEDTRIHTPKYVSISNQEYLDRQDEYIITFLGKSKDFVSFDIMIEGWIVRMQKENELES